MTYDEAITTIRKDIEEEKNWRSARQKMHEVLNAALEAQHEVQSLASKRALLEVLTTKQATLQRSIDERQAQMDQLDADYSTKKQDLDARLSTARAEVEAAKKLKQDTEAQLAAITASWHLKTKHAIPT
jgi:chromosome segregation ATPase